jgi:hypothetical protein
VTLGRLAAVQRRRAWQVKLMQRMQAQVLDGALFASQRQRSAAALLMRELGARMVRHPAFVRLNSRLFAVGVRRVHVSRRLRDVRAAQPAAAVQRGTTGT